MAVHRRYEEEDTDKEVALMWLVSNRHGVSFTSPIENVSVCIWT
jgi:hypothetical protein